ncbi:hypothetical protein HPP92_009655 [Vanilla planifolia]|uniref:Growth-regulating factor n=1 Tax=Vanilla planifolia TaxID=51239 RepID=A0A835V763_VANPL|nr:hypothetical protein HPP92_009655 [Vanilla planifolia]
MTLSLHRRQPCRHGPSLHQPASSLLHLQKAEKRLKAETPLYKNIKAVSCRRTPTLFSVWVWKKDGDGGERGTANAMSCHHLFTASQLQELEVQALMFNCFSLGLPVPSHLLVSFGRSTRKRDSEGFFPRHPPPVGWGCFKLGSRGRHRISEPGRCRRTDGKMEVFKRSLPWFQVLCKASPQRKEPSEEDYGASSASSSSGNQRLRRA